MDIFGVQNLWLFIVSSIVFVTSPGIDTMLVLNKSMSGGKKAGIYTSLGVSTGILFHTIIGVLGLSLIIAQASYVFTIIKVVGAAYLIYLGIVKLWKQKERITNSQNSNQESSKKSYWTGVITNIFNPKVAIFFLAFFPQFIDTNSNAVGISFLFLGSIFMCLTLLWFIIVSTLISLFAPLLTKSKTANKWINRVSGGLFLAMGLKLALTNK